jgi:NADH dehydrogenase [ubiquinone] 1 alpha subcomplex assembly factor 1
MSGPRLRLASKARAWLFKAQAQAQQVSRSRARDLRNTLSMEHVRPLPDVSVSERRRRTEDSQHDYHQDALAERPLVRRRHPGDPAGFGVLPLRVKHDDLARIRERSAALESQRDSLLPDDLESLLDPFLFDFRSCSERQHNAIPGGVVRPTKADGHCFRSCDAAPWSWRLMCDADIGGKSRAFLSERLHRAEDPVLVALDRRLGGGGGARRASVEASAEGQGQAVEVAAGPIDSFTSEGDTPEGAMVFSGVLSLEKSGKMVRSGYAAIESPYFEPLVDLSNCDRLQLRVRSSGGLFVANLRTPSPIAHNLYQQAFTTVPGEWTTVELPFSNFLATVRGKIDPIQRPFDEDSIQSIGILMADRVDGPFRFEIQWIRALSSQKKKVLGRYTGDSYSADYFQKQRELAAGRRS